MEFVEEKSIIITAITYPGRSSLAFTYQFVANYKSIKRLTKKKKSNNFNLSVIVKTSNIESFQPESSLNKVSTYSITIGAQA